MKLYSYWRSSCSFRVRIALNLKGTFFLRIILFLFILPSILIFLHLFFDYDWSIDRLGLKYEYKAVNLLKGEQFSPGEKENRISISIRWPLLYFLLLLLYYCCSIYVCMYVCMYGVKRVYKAQSYWLCPRACRWGLGAFWLFCHLTGSYLYLSLFLILLSLLFIINSSYIFN